MKFVYTMETMQRMSLFEKLTRAKLKDLIELEDKVFFIIEKGQLRNALGPQKKNVQKLEDIFKKKVRIVEYSDSVTQFVINLVSPLKVVEIVEDEGVITMTGSDQKTRGLMIGARAKNLRLYESIVQKYFPDIKELKVI